MCRLDKLNASPIYQKADEILKMINGLLETIPGEDFIDGFNKDDLDEEN